MVDSPGTVKQERLESEVREMRLKEEDIDTDMDGIATAEPLKREGSTSMSRMGSGTATPIGIKRHPRSPPRLQSASGSPGIKSDHEQTLGGDVTLKLEPGKPPKLARTTSHRVERRPPQLYFEYPDSTPEATSTFQTLTECTYANKYLGTTEHALECDCTEEWDPVARVNNACDETSDCINRATKMECVGDCGCGSACQNQRFQRKEYADVTVIKTEKKGYGLRTNADLRPNDFIFEYIGEVIGENVFRRRMQQYDEEGIKHFYFMSLTKGEFVDATKRGNLGRFCNHSCNPNCYVDKWVVGDKLRMGIFAERKIRAGEELVFNYNVDRYGAEPQPCYCGEPNCTGYIGGKTQTERATKLSNAIIEALGIDDAEAWDTAVAKRPRKKKTGEDDEEYVNNVEPRGLDEDGVNKVMSSLMQCKEKWIAVKLLTRIQRADDEKVRNRVVKFHGYRILKTALSTFADDVNVCLQILDILDKMPRLTRNKIQDSKIEETVETLASNDDDRVSSRSKALLDAWRKLEMAYRIPRMKRDPNATPTATVDRKLERLDRRDAERRRSRSRSRSKSPERIQAPTGPRSSAPQRAFPAARARFRPPPPLGGLPAGWFEATAANGSTYYYTQSGTTTWQRPAKPASAAPPPPPPKVVSDQQMLQDLIQNIVSSKKESSKQPSAAATPSDDTRKERKEDRWRSYPEEKQKKLYEGALQPYIMQVVSKFKNKLAKDDLKRWAKEFAKQVVESDFRKKRVENATKVSEKKGKEVKKHAQAFFDKAVKKKEAADQRRAEKRSKTDDVQSPMRSPSPVVASPSADIDDVVENLSDVEADPSQPGPAEDPTDSPSALKRRRADGSESLDESDFNLKKPRTESVEAPPPPPPPPPPPADHDLPHSEQNTPAREIATPDTSFISNATTELPTNGAIHTDQDSYLSVGSTHSSFRPNLQNHEPMQIATPPTTGSPDQDETEKASRDSQFLEVDDQTRTVDFADGVNQ